MREFIIVGLGSFLGGGMRYAISQFFNGLGWIAFPWGTFVVNIIGCAAIGFFSSVPSVLNTSARLFLTTGLCGGFTTFSTFMNESTHLAKDDSFTMSMLYLFGSILTGLTAVLAGHHIGKML